MINILHILSPGSGSFGGIDAYLLSYYSVLDRREIHFDFAFCGTNTMKMHENDELLKNSSFVELDVVSIKKRNSFSNWRRLYKSISELIANSEYDIIEVHTASPLILAVSGMALSKQKAPKIAHSHALPVPTRKVHIQLVSKICARIMMMKYDYFFSCSYEAGEVFRKARNTNRFCVINNAIDCKKFKFNPQTRKQIRNNYHIKNNTWVIGYVARLSEEKNHRFLIDIFVEINKANMNSILWIVGDGPEKDHIINRIREKGIDDNVVMFGERKDVPELLQAMDAFVVPSFQEGLCIAAIESQASGLPTIVSMGVPDACIVTGLIERVALEEGPKKWADIIMKHIESTNRDSDQSGVIEKGFDLEDSGKKLGEFYKTIL